MDFDAGYRATRQAWINGVNEFHPNPKASYILPWDEMASWEQETIKILYQNVRALLLPILNEHIKIPPEYGGYLVCSIWNVVMFQLLHDPKPSYVKHFHELDQWQQKTDTNMFEAIEAIEASVRQELFSQP